MPQTPLISVIMPCYNAEQFLREAVESILNQTYTNFELLAINDGSADNTLQILKEYAAADSRVIVIDNKENLKLIRTLNKGIELAQGEYIARMDADDISLPHRFEIELHYLLQNPNVDIVSCGFEYMSEEGALIEKHTNINCSTKGSLFASFFYTPICHPALLGKTSVFKNNSFSSEKIAVHTEDSELWGRLLLQSYQINTIDTILYRFRINPQSVSHTYTSVQNHNYVQCCKKRYEEYFSQPFDSELIQFLVNRIDSNIPKQTLIKGFSFFKQFKSQFIAKENITNKTILKEIENIYFIHFFDVLWQTFRKTPHKLFALQKLLSIVPQCVTNKAVRTYIMAKL
ncbi:MAG: glycosyltransferase [Bacteroidales bacterium]|jgi:glycosyltransferase involved in cell wall biosynthesis|nr:glycosyltransferase [Bacteroidales bacterium]